MTLAPLPTRLCGNENMDIPGQRHLPVPPHPTFPEPSRERPNILFQTRERKDLSGKMLPVEISIGDMRTPNSRAFPRRAERLNSFGIFGISGMRSRSPGKARDTELGLSGLGQGSGEWPDAAVFLSNNSRLPWFFGIKLANPPRVEPRIREFSCWEREWAGRKNTRALQRSETLNNP